MTEPWFITNLKYVTSKIGSGATPRGGSNVYTDEGPNFIRSQNIYDGYFEYNGLVHLSKEAAYELRNVEVKQNDVLINITGESVARTCIVPPKVLPARVSQHVSIIRPNPDVVDPKFLSYLLLAPLNKQKLNQLSQAGATRRALTKGHLESLKISIPNLPAQRGISEVLGSIDDLIEVNQILISHCSQLCDALWNKYQQFATRTAKLADISVVVLGGTPSRKVPEYWNGEIPWINSGKVNEFRITEPSEFITSLGLNSSSTKLMSKGTTVIAITGATLGQVSRLEIDACGNQSIVGVFNLDESLNNYLYQTIRANVDVLARSATGGAQQHINKANVEELDIPLLDEKRLRDLHRQTQPLYQAVSELIFESNELRSTRDELLPLLLSGEIKVKEVAA